jgi:hypothetical protein
MAWRFRRSAKFGPFRLTATTSGLAASVGAPGARVSVNTKGQVRRTVGIPGSGLYDTELVNPREPIAAQAPADSRRGRAESPLERRTWGKGTYLLVGLMAMVIIGHAIALGAR